MNMSSYVCCSKGDKKNQDISKLSKLLKLISDHSRLQILCILQKGEHCVCELISHLGLSQSLISHHLKDLRDAEIIVNRKEGKKVFYSLTSQGIEITNLLFQIKI